MATTIQLGVDPYTSAFFGSFWVNPEQQTFAFDFYSTLNIAAGEITFQVGGGTEDFTFCLDTS